MTVMESTDTEYEVLSALEKVGDEGICLREIRQYEHNAHLGGGGSLLVPQSEYECALDLVGRGYVRQQLKSFVGADATIDQEWFFITPDGRIYLHSLKLQREAE